MKTLHVQVDEDAVKVTLTSADDTKLNEDLTSILAEVTDAGYNGDVSLKEVEASGGQVKLHGELELEDDLHDDDVEDVEELVSNKAQELGYVVV